MFIRVGLLILLICNVPWIMGNNAQPATNSNNVSNENAENGSQSMEGEVFS